MATIAELKKSRKYVPGLLLKLIVRIADKLLSSRACVLFRTTDECYETYLRKSPTIFCTITAFYLIEVFHVESDEETSVSIDRVGSMLVISDRTGVALIKLKKTTLYLKVTNKYLTGKYFYPDIKLDEYLVKQGISTKGYFSTTKQMRAEEYLLTENKKIYIHGKGTWKKASSFGLNCEGDKVLVFEVVHATHLSILDLGEDTIV